MVSSSQRTRRRIKLDVPDASARDDNKYTKRKRRSTPHRTIRRQQAIAVLILAASVWVISRYLKRLWIESVPNRREGGPSTPRHIFQRRWKPSQFTTRQEVMDPTLSVVDREQNKSSKALELLFQEHRQTDQQHLKSQQTTTIVQAWLNHLDRDIDANLAGGIRWIRPYLLPPLPNHQESAQFYPNSDKSDRDIFKAQRHVKTMQWKQEWEEIKRRRNDTDDSKPPVDYTNAEKYVYPTITLDATTIPNFYPQLTSLKDMLENWPQDQDFTGTINETLLHFDYTDPLQRAAAGRFRDAGLPFKLIRVPEVALATQKWTDEYVASQFAPSGHSPLSQPPLVQGYAQESPNNFFAFFIPQKWHAATLGIPPTRSNNWDYATWAEHARYADAVALSPDQPHFYWQAGVDREERHQDPSKWTFISRDLPSFSSPNDNFIVFHADQQKGIQCRFGERGVVAATHYDSGRNMVGMVIGAKRYILSPPNQCSKLGIFSDRNAPIFRHSLLNFGHLKYLNHTDMSQEERAWLERASTSLAVETVLKAGEVLYIPSFWFHYIVSLQKSAQCNVRSGIDKEGTETFGGYKDVSKCSD